MNILMITPRIDPSNDVFGFLHGWAKRIAAKVDNLYIITLKSPEINLGDNAKIYSLSGSKPKIVKQFHSTIRKLLREKDIDIIFTQMYLEFALAAYPYARFYKKPIVTWYAHGNVDFKLKLVNKLVNKIVTSSREGCRIESSKVKIIGQGIDTDYFKPGSEKASYLLSVGRISASKNIEVMIKAIAILKKDFPDIKLLIIGQPYGPGSDKYLEKIKSMIKMQGLERNISYLGQVQHDKILPYYQKSQLFMTASTTGSLDKTTLEAMSCSIPVIVCNEAYKTVLGDHANNLMFAPGNADELALKVSNILKDKLRAKLGKSLRDIVISGHSINNFIDQLLLQFEESKYYKTKSLADKQVDL